MPESDTEDLTTRLSRIRAMLCPNQKFEDEIERCPCQRGGHDAGLGHGHETGCKDLKDALDQIED